MCLAQSALKGLSGIDIPLNELNENTLDLFMADLMLNAVARTFKTQSALFFG